MNARTNVLDRLETSPANARSLPWPARLVFAALSRIRIGRLTIRLPDGSERVYGQGEGPEATWILHNTDFCRALLTGCDIALAEAYMRGDWSTPDLPQLLLLLAKNGEHLGEAYYARGLQAWWFRLRHALRMNTKRRARKNIEAHYDLGNAFYRLWLDETMTYSSALFAGESSRSLAEAQQAKYDRILRQIAAPAGGEILEIGCGWGGFAEWAARAGYRLTCITLSPSQRDYAQARMQAAGLAERVQIELCDYRDVAQRFRRRFDGLASIEMFEAVGQQYWQTYFEAVARALKPGARAAIQVITIDERRFERYAATSDFIQQFIFPGGMLPSPERFLAHAERAGLSLEDRFEFGADYAETLGRWLAAFDARHVEVRAQGFNEAFVRLWRFYLAYCIAGFKGGMITVGQYTLGSKR
jgi:Cyclopropane fatty acid synthase and related methyltransferases